MNPFFAAVDLSGAPLGADALAAPLPALALAETAAQMTLRHDWGAAWAPSPDRNRPSVLHVQGLLAIGDVRLTNRRRLPETSLETRPQATDLAAVVDHYRRFGVAGFSDLVGDFSFVIWDAPRRRLVAARDALGVRDLYFRQAGTRIFVGSHLDCFSPADLDRSFLAEFIAGFPPSDGRTAFTGVERVHPGGYLLAEDGRVSHGRYWRAEDYRFRRTAVDEREAVAEFRDLFDQAVTAQTDDGLAVWAQLSGGLDSSSIVATAECLASQGVGSGLAGTETVVDTLGDGDETRYSDAVVAQYGLRNERITDAWPWQRDLIGLPSFADPRAFLPFYARDRALRNAVSHNGGQVLLSGFGSDHYLAGSYDYIADLAAEGHYRVAAGQLVDLAVATRRSVWDLAGRHVIAPLGPQWLRNRLTGDRAPVPSWLTPGLLDDRYRSELQPTRDGGAGRIYAAQQEREIGAIGGQLERGLFEQGLEIRYPFLHRPLVEFTLRLPLALRFRPNRPKWILREAMGSRLPDLVRNRQGKGGIDGRVTWAFEHERRLLEALIDDSHLADLGLVDRAKFRQEFDRARAGVVESTISLFSTLALETWLAVRSGWWARRGSALQSPSQVSSTKEQQYEIPIC